MDRRRIGRHFQLRERESEVGGSWATRMDVVMGNQLQAKVFNLRFPAFSIVAIDVVGKERVMDPTTETVANLEGASLRGGFRPRASECL